MSSRREHHKHCSPENRKTPFPQYLHFPQCLKALFCNVPTQNKCVHYPRCRCNITTRLQEKSGLTTAWWCCIPLLAVRGQCECPESWSNCTKLHHASFYAGCWLTHWNLAYSGFFPSSLLPHRKAVHIHTQYRLGRCRAVNKVGCHLTRSDCWQYPKWGGQPVKAPQHRELSSFLLTHACFWQLHYTA